MDQEGRGGGRSTAPAGTFVTIRAQTYTDIQTYTDTHIHTNLQTCIYTYVHTYIHTYIHTCRHTHTCMHTYIQTHEENNIIKEAGSHKTRQARTCRHTNSEETKKPRRPAGKTDSTSGRVSKRHVSSAFGLTPSYAFQNNPRSISGRVTSAIFPCRAGESCHKKFAPLKMGPHQVAVFVLA